MEAFRKYVRGDFEPDINYEGLQSVKSIHSDLAIALAEFREFCDNLNHHFKVEGFRGTDLEIGYSIDDRPNARADRYNDKDIIVLNLGLVILIRNVFARSIEVGTIEKMLFSGNFEKEFYLESISLKPNVADVLSGLNEVKDPVDKNSKFFLSFFTKTALLYIFNHELAHIWNGHVEFNASTGGHSTMIDEVGFSDISSISYLSYALEMDADARAIHALMMNNFGAEGYKNTFIPKEVIEIDGFYTNLLVFIFCLQVVISILHIAVAPDGGDDSARLHPSATLRRKWMMLSVRNVLNNSPGIDQIEVDRICDIATFGAASAISSAFTALDLAKSLKILSKEPSQSDFLIHVAYRMLYSKLKQFMRGKRITPPSYKPYISPFTQYEIKSYKVNIIFSNLL